MAPNSLYPAFIRLDYHSAYAPHVMILPTKEWLPTSIGGTLGSYEGWSGIPVDAEDMVNDLVTAMKPFFLASTTFDLATVYTMAAAVAPAIPQATVGLAVAGTNVDVVSQAKAVQQTLSMRTTGGGHMKMVFLDAPAGSGFDKAFPAGFSAAELALVAQLRNDLNAWSGRDNSQPGPAISVTYTLNEKLRKEYRMT